MDTREQYNVQAEQFLETFMGSESKVDHYRSVPSPSGGPDTCDDRMDLTHLIFHAESIYLLVESGIPFFRKRALGCPETFSDPETEHFQFRK